MIGELASPSGGRGRSPSQADVAAIAGVSAQTVSRVVNGLDNVDERTRERVLAVIQAMGYQRTNVARAPLLGRFQMLGVITFDLTAHGNARTLAAICLAAQAAGYAVTIAGVRQATEDAVQEAFSLLAQQAVDGVVVVEAQILDRRGLRLNSGVPVVVADGDPEHRFPMVDSNQVAGAVAATRHLLELGHRRVWHVSGPADSHSARRRAAAWQSTLEDAGASIPPIQRGDWTAESGYRIGQELATRADVTAVFAANDQMALGVMLALHQAGRIVPQDVSVVGFDDVPESVCFPPPLTTVHQDFEEIGRQCVALLLEQVHGTGPREQRFVSVQPELVVRGSTAPPPM